MPDNSEYRKEIERLKIDGKKSPSIKKGTIVAGLVGLLLVGVGLFFLNISETMSYIGGVLAILAFITMFFLPGDKKSDFKDVPYVRMVERPDYVFSQLSRQIDDMKK